MIVRQFYGILRVFKHFLRFFLDLLEGFSFGRQTKKQENCDPAFNRTIFGAKNDRKLKEDFTFHHLDPFQFLFIRQTRKKEFVKTTRNETKNF